jgi:hypothetical protein
VLRPALGAIGVATVAVAGVELAVHSAARASSSAPITQRGFGFPAWMAGPLHHVMSTQLTSRAYGLLVLAMCAGYVLAVANHRALRAGPVLAAVAVLHLAFMLAPPLGLTDMTNYVGYARLGELHHLSPYVHTPAAAAADPSFPWTTWRHYRSPYGPLFTLLTYALAPLGIVWTFWGLKTIVALAAGGCLALVWRCARLLGRPPLGAVVLVGLNPAWLVWAVGGGHNDTLMELLVLAALALALTSRHAFAGGAAVAAAAVKVPALLVLPFLALARGGSRRRLLAGAGVAAALVGLTTLIAFGSLAPLTAFDRQANFVSQRGLVGQLVSAFGGSALSPAVRDVAAVALVGVVGGCLVWAWRTGRWVDGYAWAATGMVAALLWVFPWYVVWLLPAAALARHSAVRVGAVALTLVLLWGFTPHATLLAWLGLG